MSSTKLTADLIDKPAIWRLYLEVKPDALEVVVYSTHNDQSLMHHRIEFDKAASSTLQALEEAVYDNPLLLAEFERVSVLIDTPRFMIAPDSIVDDDMAASIAEDFWGSDTTTLLIDQLPVPGMRMLMAPDRAVAAFLARTFPTTVPHHPIATLVTYFYNKDRMNNTSRMYVHLRDGMVDIIHFNNGTVKVANSYAVTNADDVVYFVMLVASKSDFDVEADELMLCGDTRQREAVAPELRKYVRYVMPVVFPSMMYHAGKDALESPFELIVMPLCE